MVFPILVTAGVTFGVGSIVSTHPFCASSGSEEETQALTAPKVQDATCKEIFAAALKGWGIGGMGFGAGMATNSIVSTTAAISLPAAMTVVLVAGCLIVAGTCIDMGCSDCGDQEDDAYPPADIDISRVSITESKTGTIAVRYGSVDSDIELGTPSSA